jgi:putative hemolysin
MKKIFSISLFAGLILAVTLAMIVRLDNKQAIGLTKPASVNCTKQGGRLEIQNTPKGTMGVCYFDDNRQCEEWALFRNECPKGGLKVTGYGTKAARYCKIIGGEYTIEAEWVANTAKDQLKEPGSCKLPNGEICDVWKLWDGDCPKY